MAWGKTIGGALSGAGTGFMMGGPWGALAGAAAGGLMGNMGAREQQKAQAAQNMAAATQTENSNWSGLGQGQMQYGGPNNFGEVQQGLASAAQSYQAGVAAKKIEAPTVDTGSTMSAEAPQSGINNDLIAANETDNPWAHTANEYAKKQTIYGVRS